MRFFSLSLSLSLLLSSFGLMYGQSAPQQPLPEMSSTAIECCSVEEFALLIDIARPETVWEDCSVIAGSATVFYPDEGPGGTVEVCVNFPSSTGMLPYLEVYELGDFTSQTSVGNTTQLCTTVSFPEFDPEGEVLGYKTLSFYVVPKKINSFNFPFIKNGINGSLETGSLACSCNNQDDEAIPFVGRDRLTFQNGVTVPVSQTYQIPNGANLSNLIGPQGGLTHLFQDPSVSANSTVRILLEGELNVDIDYTLGNASGTFMSSLTLGDHSKINILPGKTFNVVNTAIEGCREVWDAITIMPGAKLNLNNSRVTGGERAIRIEDGGKLFAERVEFKNNYLSIFTPGGGGSRGFSKVEASVLGSRFDFKVSNGIDVPQQFGNATPFLLRPYFGQVPKAGAEFNRTESGIVFANSVRSTRKNLFTHLANGLIFNASAGAVSGSTFEDLPSVSGQGVSGNGVWVTDLSSRGGQSHVTITGDETLNGSSGVNFRNMESAIRLDNANDVRVEGAYIQDVKNGLLANTAQRIRFNRNYVESSQYGFARIGLGYFAFTRLADNEFLAGGTPSSARPGVAVYLGGFGSGLINSHIVNDNKIRLDGATHGLLTEAFNRLDFRENSISWEGNMFGTSAASLFGGYGPTIRDNFILGRTDQAFTEASGIELFMVNRPIVSCNAIDLVESSLFFLGNNQGARIQGNALLRSGTGLQLGSPLIFNDPTVTGPQIHRGNRWVGPYQGFGAAFYNSDPTLRSASRFIVNSTFDPKFLPPSFNPGTNGWFEDDMNSATPSYVCLAGSPPGGVLPVFDELANQIIKGDYSSSGPWQATNWLANYRVYRGVERGDLLSGDYPKWTEWLAKPGQDTVANYFAVEETLDDLYQLSSTESQSLEAFYRDLDTLHQQYLQHTLRRFQDSTANWVLEDSLRRQVQASIDTVRAEAQPWLTQLQERATLRLANVQTVNTALSGSKVYLDGLRKVNAAEIDFLQFGMEKLNNHRATLVQIAETCPLDGGEAVYRARAMAAALGEALTIDAAQNCVSVPPTEKRLTSPLPFATAVYPNPAKERIQFSAGGELVFGVKLYDLAGRLLVERDFKDLPQTSGALPLPTLKPGTYLVSLELAEQQFSTHLIQVQ